MTRRPHWSAVPHCHCQLATALVLWQQSLPLTRGNRCSFSGLAVAIFVQDPEVAPAYPGEAFAKLYGLTGAELRVLLALAPGLSVKDAAAMLGIGEVTARTHLQHVYAKTRTSKQTELLNLFRNAIRRSRLSSASGFCRSGRYRPLLASYECMRPKGSGRGTVRTAAMSLAQEPQQEVR